MYPQNDRALPVAPVSSRLYVQANKAGRDAGATVLVAFCEVS